MRASGADNPAYDFTAALGEWVTRLFPDAKQQAYVLPVKTTARQAEQLIAGDVVRVHLELVDVS